jgi:hypothetical protein
MKIDHISEDGIRRLVDEFYARVRADTELAPIFNRAIPGDWGLHLATMRDFWSSVMLTSGRYKGNPVATTTLSSEEYLTRKKVNFDDPTTASSLSPRRQPGSVSCHTSSILMTTTISPIVESATGPTSHLIWLCGRSLIRFSRPKVRRALVWGCRTCTNSCGGSPATLALPASWEGGRLSISCFAQSRQTGPSRCPAERRSRIRICSSAMIVQR